LLQGSIGVAIIILSSTKNWMWVWTFPMQATSTKSTISSQDSCGEPQKITQPLYENHDYLQKPAHIGKVEKIS